MHWIQGLKNEGVLIHVEPFYNAVDGGLWIAPEAKSTNSNSHSIGVGAGIGLITP